MTCLRLALFAAALATSSVPALAQQLNPLTAIARFESSYGTDTAMSSVPGSHASGIFQDQPGTWSTALGLAGLSVADYPTPLSSPASVQFAANAALYNRRGFSDWSCSGCDPKLTAYIASKGGASAFATPGSLSTSPAAYAALGVDTAEGLRAYFKSDAADSVAALPTGDTSGSGAAGADKSRIFQSLWTQLVTNLQPSVTQAMNQIGNFAGGALSAALLLAIILAAITTAIHKRSFETLIPFFVKGAVIAAMVGIGGQAYDLYVVGPVTQFPTWWQANLTGASGATVVSTFDDVDNAMYATEQSLRQKAGYNVGTQLSILAASCTIYVALLILFIVKLATTVSVDFLLIIGRLMILFALFHRTEFLVWGWVRAVATALLFLLALDIVLGLYSGIMQNLMTATYSTEKSFWGAAGTMFILGASTGLIGKMVSLIGGGVNAGLSAAGHWISGMAVAAGAATAVGAAAGGASAAAGGSRALDGISQAADNVSRWTKTVGSSLSRGEA